jgi:hypothetical protein
MAPNEKWWDEYDLWAGKKCKRELSWLGTIVSYLETEEEQDQGNQKCVSRMIEQCSEMLEYEM